MGKKSFKKVLLNAVLFAAFGLASGLKRAALGRYIGLNLALSWWSERRSRPRQEPPPVNKADNSTDVQTDVPIPVLLGLGLLDGNVFDLSAKQDQSFPLYAGIGYGAIIGPTDSIDLVDRDTISVDSNGVLQSFTLIPKDADSSLNIESQANIRKAVRFSNDASKTYSNVFLKWFSRGQFSPSTSVTITTLKSSLVNVISSFSVGEAVLSSRGSHLTQYHHPQTHEESTYFQNMGTGTGMVIDISTLLGFGANIRDVITLRDVNSNIIATSEVTGYNEVAAMGYELDRYNLRTGRVRFVPTTKRHLVLSYPFSQQQLDSADTITIYRFGGARTADAYLLATSSSITNKNKLAWMAVEVRDPGYTVNNVTFSIPSIQVLAYRGVFWAWENLDSGNGQTMYVRTGSVAYNKNPFAYIYEIMCNPYFSRGGGPSLFNIQNLLVNFAEANTTDSNLEGSGNVQWQIHGFTLSGESEVRQYIEAILRHIHADYFIDANNRINFFLNNGKIYTDSGYASLSPSNATILHRDRINRRLERGEIGELMFKISERSSQVEVNEWRVRYVKPEKAFIADTYISISDTIGQFMTQETRPKTLEYQGFFEERYARKAALIERNRESNETLFFELEMDIEGLSVTPGDIIFLPAYKGSWDLSNPQERQISPTSAAISAGDHTLYFDYEDSILLEGSISGASLVTSASYTAASAVSVNKTSNVGGVKLGHGVVKVTCYGVTASVPGEVCTVTRAGYTTRNFIVLHCNTVTSGTYEIFLSVRPLFDLEVGDTVELDGYEDLIVEESGYYDSGYWVRVDGTYSTDPVGKLVTLRRYLGLRQLVEDRFARVQEMRFNDEMKVTLTARVYDPESYDVTLDQYGVFVAVEPTEQFVDPSHNAPPTPQFTDFKVNYLTALDGTVKYEAVISLSGINTVSTDRVVLSLYTADKTVTGNIAELEVSGLEVSATQAGSSGNSLSVAFLNPGSALANCTFAVVGDRLDITLRHDGVSLIADADDVVQDWVNFASDQIKNIFSIAGSGATILGAMSETSLSGGSESDEKSLISSMTLSRGQTAVSIPLPYEHSSGTATPTKYWATAIAYNRNNLSSGIASSYTDLSGFVTIEDNRPPEAAYPPPTPEFISAECVYGNILRVVSKKYTRSDMRYLELRNDDLDWGMFGTGGPDDTYVGSFDQQVVLEQRDNLPDTRTIEYYLKIKNEFGFYSPTAGYIQLTDTAPIQIPTGNVETLVAGNTVFVSITPYSSGEYEPDVIKYSLWNQAGDTKLTESSVPRLVYTVPYSQFGDSDTYDLTFRVMAHDRLTDTLADGIQSNPVTVVLEKIASASFQLDALRKAVSRQLFRLDEWGNVPYSLNQGEQMILDATQGYSFLQERVLDPSTEYTVSVFLQKVSGTDPVQLTISGPVVGSPLVISHTTTGLTYYALKFTTTSASGPIPPTVFTVSSTEDSVASKLMLNYGDLALGYLLHPDDQAIPERVRQVQNEVFTNALTMVNNLREMNQNLIQQGTEITQNDFNISLRVRKDRAVSEINLSPEGVSISGRKIIIDGETVFINTTGNYWGTFVSQVDTNVWDVQVNSLLEMPSSGTIYMLVSAGATINDNDTFSSAITFTKDSVDPQTGYVRITITSGTPTIKKFFINSNSFSVTRIDGGRIIADTIETDHLQANSIIASKIAAQEIGADKLIAKEIIADVVKLYGANNIVIDPSAGIFIFHNNNLFTNASSHYNIEFTSTTQGQVLTSSLSQVPSAGDFLSIADSSNPYNGALRKILSVGTSGLYTVFTVDQFAVSPGITLCDFVLRSVTTGSYIKISIDGSGVPSIEMYSGTTPTPAGTKWTPAGFSLKEGSIDIGSGANSFHVDNAGNMWFGADLLTNAKWSVNSSGTMKVGIGNDSFNVDNTGNMWIGHANQLSAPFAVDKDGSVRAANLTLQNVDKIYYIVNTTFPLNGYEAQMGAGYMYTSGGVRVPKFVFDIPAADTTGVTATDKTSGLTFCNLLVTWNGGVFVYEGLGGITGAEKRANINNLAVRVYVPKVYKTSDDSLFNPVSVRVGVELTALLPTASSTVSVTVEDDEFDTSLYSGSGFWLDLPILSLLSDAQVAQVFTNYSGTIAVNITLQYYNPYVGSTVECYIKPDASLFYVDFRYLAENAIL